MKDYNMASSLYSNTWSSIYECKTILIKLYCSTIPIIQHCPAVAAPETTLT